MRTIGHTAMLWAAASTFGGAAGAALGGVLTGAGLVDDGASFGAALLAALTGGGAALLQGLVLRRGAGAWAAASAFGSGLGWLVATNVLGVALADLRGSLPMALAAGAIAGCVCAIVQSWWLAAQGVSARTWVAASAGAGAAAAALRFCMAGVAPHALALVVPAVTLGLVLEAFPAFERRALLARPRADAGQGIARRSREIGARNTAQIA